MACGCKGDSPKKNDLNEDNKINFTIFNGIFNFILIMFILLILSPILFIGVTYLVFNQTVLNKENKISDLVKPILILKNKFFNREENDEDDDVEDDLDDDYEVVGLETIVRNE